MSRDNEVDLLKFPVLKSHRMDGGRYIGTGDCFINRDPETGYVNMGTYRMQVHERNLLGVWQSPGQQGRLIAERYWKQGKACPVVVTFGGDPLLFFLSYTKFPFGISELDRAGGMLGRPVEVIKGPLTGLPIPAHAEVVIEGEITFTVRGQEPRVLKAGPKSISARKNSTHCAKLPRGRGAAWRI